MKSPFSFGQIVIAYEYIHDMSPAYDSDEQNSSKLADEIWESFDNRTRGEITDYWNRPDGVQ